MKKIVLFMTMIIMTLFIVGCQKKENMPYGAEKIDYDKVEGINKDGPIAESNHYENVPPMADKSYIEVGPEHFEVPEIENLPTAEMAINPDYGDVPIFVPVHKD